MTRDISIAAVMILLKSFQMLCSLFCYEDLLNPLLLKLPASLLSLSRILHINYFSTICPMSCPWLLMCSWFSCLVVWMPAVDHNSDATCPGCRDYVFNPTHARDTPSRLYNLIGKTRVRPQITLRNRNMILY